MSLLFGFAMIVGQIFGIIYLLGGRDVMPKRLKVASGIAQILILAATLSLAMKD